MDPVASSCSPARRPLGQAYELALNEFAADLDDVALQSGKRRIYEDQKEFFALTNPTSALLDLARDAVRRLAG